MVAGRHDDGTAGWAHRRRTGLAGAGAGQNDLENTSGWLQLAIGASCYGQGDDPRQAIFRSAMATLHALRTSGFRAVTVTVTVQQCSEEARLRGPGLRPDELPADDLVAEQDGAVA
jgi:hypothetical protein